MAAERAPFGEEITDGTRSNGPEIEAFGGFDWVRADYTLQTTAGVATSASLLAWPQPDGLATLRCSYRRAGPPDAVAAPLQQLAISLRPTS